ncbi:unnamed protein product [Protopolystoma xenopodis]|uniref:Uncharacterized protein n=1 Tax=Protopolystoma xenopodis TaxID=117903 RepID=A0A3S5BBQ3_9PLAT|nr:unnamed protein product [Protopolystoma xenopodis]
MPSANQLYCPQNRECGVISIPLSMVHFILNWLSLSDVVFGIVFNASLHQYPPQALFFSQWFPCRPAHPSNHRSPAYSLLPIGSGCPEAILACDSDSYFQGVFVSGGKTASNIGIS